MTDFEKLAVAMLLAIVSGATGGILSTRVADDRRRQRVAKQVAIAFWEELSATAFAGGTSGTQAYWTFGGFSSQTFDSQFAEVAGVLPESLARDLMRYHWRMKMLNEQGPGAQHFGTPIQEMVDIRERLLENLDTYTKGGKVE